MKLARYEVIRELGKGAMGVVYLAKDPLIGRLVALKTIRPSNGMDGSEAHEFRQRFVREAQAAGILSHPSIVTVHDIGDDPASGISFIAMEYVEGKNLKEIIADGQRLSYPELAEIIAQVADALDYAHCRGIIHRDVKPANIIRHEPGKAKITDFGIAKIASLHGSLTTTGQFIGTPNYMSPEQVKGAHVDGRTDIFSLGVVLYECLVRRKPFGGESLTTISYRIVHEDYPRLTTIDPAIPVEFDEIVARCLQKDPADRFQRAREVGDAIEAFIEGDVRRNRVEPQQFESTVVASDADRIPTVELPFPESDHERIDSPSVLDVAREAGLSPWRRKFEELRRRIVDRRELQRLLRRPISPLLFFGSASAALLLALVPMFLIAGARMEVAPVDVKREALVKKQRELRTAGAEFIRSGDVESAYRTYSDLLKLAPKSPAVAEIVQQLEAIRVEQMTLRQRFEEARSRLEEGKALFEQKKYEESIPYFEQAFHLDPNLDETVNYLRMTREQIALQEQLRARQLARQAASRPASRPAATDTAPEEVGVAALVTIVDSPVADGYVMVKVAGQTEVHENLWEESKGFFRRKIPRKINLYREVAARESAVEVWVVVPSLSISEHRVMRQEFAAGLVQRLLIQIDSRSKKVSMSITR